MAEFEKRLGANQSPQGFMFPNRIFGKNFLGPEVEYNYHPCYLPNLNKAVARNRTDTLAAEIRRRLATGSNGGATSVSIVFHFLEI